jgi:hypothetical protein
MTKSAKRKKPLPIAQTLAGPLLVPPIVGYAATKDQAARLAEYGANPVFREGDGAETLTEALKYFRKRKATLAICTEGRVFGEKRKQVTDAFDLIDQAGVRIYDLEHPTEARITQHQERAQTEAARYNRIGDHRTARSRGKKGGTAKGIAAAERRKAADPHGLIPRIVEHPGISRPIKRELLKGVTSLTTALRLLKAGKL